MSKKLKLQYQFLLGKTKKEISGELGLEYNYYPADVWYYELNVTFYFRKTTLILHFTEGVVTGISIKKHYGKIST
ncbi:MULTISPECIES: hypothetical protein [Flavobacteriales]|jgi:hypothetical protein|uniref:hypothetical protein n=1 Tax=Flavobacteriales TaxID=200644 RepID=UPI00034B16BD|nr:hypothetical protein [Flavobacterium sp. B17]